MSNRRGPPRPRERKHHRLTYLPVGEISNMATSKVSGIRLSGICCAVPEQARTIADETGLFTREEVQRISQSTGILQRHIAPEGMCTSDLCCAAAVSLLDEMKYDRSSIDLLLFITQTPDYVLPATACILQTRLGLPKSC